VIVHKARSTGLVASTGNFGKFRKCGSGKCWRRVWIPTAVLAVLFASACTAGSQGSARAGPSTRGSQTETNDLKVTARNTAVWLASLFDVQSPAWTKGVLAAEPCSGSSRFCPDQMATTPDGKILALAGVSGETRVFNVVSRQRLLDEPAVITSSATIGRVGVWLSPDGRLVARGLSILDSKGEEKTIGFQIWDTSNGRPLLTDGPTRASAWPPIDAVGLQSRKAFVIVLQDYPGMTSWYVLGLVGSQYKVVAAHHTWREPVAITYLSDQGNWLLDLGDSYATWAPPNKPSLTIVPCNSGWPVSKINIRRKLYVCAAGGSRLNGGDSALFWDITRKLPFTTLIDRQRIGHVKDLTVLDNGQSLAILASPPSERETTISGTTTLLLYSLNPHPSEDRTISLPSISAGWSVQQVGHFVVVFGDTTRGGFCCFAAFPWPRQE
jgi:hypothetical protein